MKPVVCTITPRSTDFSRFKQTKTCFSQTNISQLFYIATTFNLRLDEGLSNFGIDDKNILYYLDDDLYAWDKFVSFSQVIGVLVRGNSWLDEAGAKILGNDLFLLINEFLKTRVNIRPTRT